jgi:predicted pyridoxine 5'-phosphate oxidase superfamily flavin-nucleotide-binding protein
VPPDGEGDSPAGDPVAEAVAAVDTQLAQTPDNVRNTPEFRALEAQLRSSARAKGAAEKAAATARQEAETYRQAAEAQRQAALETQIASLDPVAVAAYTELAELGQSDPVAAARRLAELLSTAQSGQQPVPDPAAPPAPPEGGPVPAQTAPPPILGGVDGSAPLTQPQGEDIAALTKALDDRYAGIVERNQDLTQRNRVTGRDRAAGFIAYLGSAYLKAKNPTR